MNEMTIKEMRKEKEALESKLSCLFDDFEEKTKIAVKRVDVVWFAGELAGEDRWRKVSVILEGI